MKATLKINDKEIDITEEELKGLEEKKLSGKRWRAEKGQEYWRIYDDGFIGKTDDLYGEYSNDYSIGNCFKTKEEAEFHKNELIYTQMLKDYILEHSEKIDWKNENQEKWMVAYNFKRQEIDFQSSSVWKWSAINCSNKRVLEDAVNYIGKNNFIKFVLKDYDEVKKNEGTA